MQANKLVLIPVIVIIVSILTTSVFGFSDKIYFNPPNVAFALNLVFWLLATISIAYISAKSFIKEGSAIVLIISCSIIVLGLSLIISGWVTNFSGNYSVAIANIGIFASAALQVLCGILSLTDKTESKIKNRIKALIPIYIVTVVFVLAISALALLGFLPTFFTTSGPTLLRQAVLGSGILFFAIACILFIGQYLKSKALSLYWYALAIGLFSVSLSSTFEVKVLGDLPTWLGRIGLYIGTIYLMAAILSTKKKAEGIDRASAWARAFETNSEQFEALFSNMLDAFVYGKIIVDKEGKPVDWVFLDVNSSYGRIAGLAKDQILGKTVSELYPEEHNDPLDWIGKYGRVALTGEPTHFEGYRQSFKKWIHVSAYCPKEGYFIALFEDITERKKAEDKLKNAKEQYDLLFNSVNEGFANYRAVYDENGRLNDLLVLEINPAGAKYSGVAREEQLGKTWRQVWVGIEDSVFDLYRQVDETGSARNFEHFSNITSRWYGISIYKISKDQFAVTFTDITERKQLQQKIEEYTKNLEDLVEQRTKQLKDAERLAAIGATAGIVGHDIRNPLQAITGDLYLVKTDLSSIPESEEKQAIQESLIAIENNIDYINKIVQDLQDYARPLNPKPEEADLKLIITKLFAKNNMPDNIQLSIKVENSAEKISTDSYYINRIMFNLINNAVQAMPNGGKLNVHAFRDSKDLVMTVKDTGVGIPKDIQGKMFTPMFTTKSKGQGFGLPVVKRMTESLGGTVTFESQESKGTTFTVRLPLTR
jgi:PAS domain S-box-containing protein